MGVVDFINSLTTNHLLTIGVVLLAILYFIYTLSESRSKLVTEPFDVTEEPNVFMPNTSTSLNTPDYETYKRIIDVYNEILDRQPTPQELFDNFNKIKSGETTIRKIRDSLLGSGEHDRKDKIQNNTATHDAAKSVNDMQIADTVSKKYVSIAGKKPTEKTIEYLKEQYVNSGMSDEKLSSLIEDMTGTSIDNVYKKAPSAAVVAKAPVAASVAVKAASAPQAAVHQVPQPTVVADHSQHQPDAAVHPTHPQHSTESQVNTSAQSTASTYSNTGGSTTIIERPTIYNYYGSANGGKSCNSKAGHCDKAAADDMEAPAYDPNDPTNYDNQMSECLNKDAMGHKLDQRDESMLADLQNERNMSELEYGCQRANPMLDCAADNKVYTNADDSGKLFPGFEWAVPDKKLPTPPSTVYSQIDQTSLVGTLLSDAQKTKVGSVMPGFQYQDDASCAATKY